MVANADDTLQALADPMRRAILERLLTGPLPVKEIAAGLPVSRPAVSQHLRVLREAGLVSERRQGTSRIYRLEQGGLTALRTYLEGFWEAALAQFADAVEGNERRQG